MHHVLLHNAFLPCFPMKKFTFWMITYLFWILSGQLHGHLNKNSIVYMYIHMIIASCQGTQPVLEMCRIWNRLWPMKPHALDIHAWIVYIALTLVANMFMYLVYSFPCKLTLNWVTMIVVNCWGEKGFQSTIIVILESHQLWISGFFLYQELYTAP